MSNSTEIKFASLRIEGWRQFGRIDIELHPQLTVITGSNGAGKSTLLNIFSGHFGYQRPFLATPWRDESGEYKYFTGIVNLFRSFFPLVPSNVPQVGDITYTNGAQAIAQLPGSGRHSIQFSPLLRNNPCKAFTFHPIADYRAYRAVSQIPTQTNASATGLRPFQR